MAKIGKRKDAKKAICLALFILLKKIPYDEITVKQISERAGVSRMSFYRYFENKEDVFVYYCDEKFIEFNDIIHRVHITNMKGLMREFLDFILKDAESVNVLIDADKYSILLPLYEKYVAYLYRKYVKEEHPSTTVIDKYSISFLSGGLYNTTLKWFKDGNKDSAEEIANELCELLKRYVD